MARRGHRPPKVAINLKPHHGCFAADGAQHRCMAKPTCKVSERAKINSPSSATPQCLERCNQRVRVTVVGAKLSRGTISNIVELKACETGLPFRRRK